MIVDASAIVAIIRGEEDALELATAFRGVTSARVSAPTLLEAAHKLDRIDITGTSSALDAFVARTRLEIIPFDAEHAAVARDARRRYGKGSGHPANLNFGDCMTYAAAYIADEPLLYKGDDFKHTDLKSALD